ncbi:MAG: hypothetical protein AB1765_00295 [Candidatus Hydrogenedentota bacterium]
MTKSEKIVIVIFILFIISGIIFFHLERFGDASNYYLMTISLLKDGDLEFSQKDFNRIKENPFSDVPAGTILIFSNGKYYFGKPYIYALLNVPLFYFIKEKSFLFVNLFLFFTMVFLSIRYLLKKNSFFRSAVFTIFYFFLSIVPFYILWIHEEIFNFFIVFIFFYFLLNFKATDKTYYLYLAAVCCGIGSAIKLINSLLILPLLLTLVRKNIKIITNFIIVMLLPVFIILGLFYIHTGILTYFSGDIREMYYKLDDMPYSNPLYPYKTHGRDVKLDEMVPPVNKSFVIPNIFYFLFGRFTGILWYFFPLITILFFYDKRSPLRYHLLCLFILWVVCLCVGRWYNYYGGVPLGNRYFHLYPAFIFLVANIRFKKIFTVLVVFACVLILPLYAHPYLHSSMPYSHTVYFPYNLMPVEKNQLPGLPFWGKPIKPFWWVRYDNTYVQRKAYYSDIFFFVLDFSGELRKDSIFIKEKERFKALIEIPEDVSPLFKIVFCPLRNQVINEDRVASVKVSYNNQHYNVVLENDKEAYLILRRPDDKPIKRIEKKWYQTELNIKPEACDIFLKIITF